ncbi:hypothetical protein [Actinoplanes sp. NPDC049118]|uniref:hypothetical protein n=1 Tax=Actinoplanes sp. NPDC049118 TaxID=3155769 RepID=UPI0033E782B8
MVEVRVRFVLDKKGIAACAVGPELRHAVHDIAATALPYAEFISPRDTGDYERSWEIVDTIVTDIGRPPMARVTAQLANTSDHAILVEVGTPTVDPHRVLAKVLDWIDVLGRGT